MSEAVVDALYAVPAGALEQDETSEQAVSLCLSYRPFVEGESELQ